jgi:hypothetical protein
MINKIAGIGLGNPSFDLFQMPLLRFQIGLHSLAEQVCAIAIHGVSQRVERSHFVGFKPETNGLLFHNL